MSELIITGPVPPPNRQFCTPCVLYFKAQVMTAHADWISRVQNDGNEKNIIEADLRKMAPEGTQPPRLAVAVAMVNGLPALGMTWVCWTHMAVVMFQEATGLARAATADVDLAAAQAASGQVMLPVTRRARPS